MGYRVKLSGGTASLSHRRTGYIWDGIDLNAAPHPAFQLFDWWMFDLFTLMEVRKLHFNALTPWWKHFLLKYKASDKSEVQEIGHLIVMLRHRDCSDRRDHVYALLSLDKSCEVQRFHPDYAIDEAELFVRLCVTRLSEWPRDWRLGASRGFKLDHQTLFVERLDPCLLHGRNLFHKAVG